jgi:hypothetical protein
MVVLFRQDTSKSETCSWANSYHIIQFFIYSGCISKLNPPFPLYSTGPVITVTGHKYLIILLFYLSSTLFASAWNLTVYTMPNGYVTKSITSTDMLIQAFLQVIY